VNLGKLGKPERLVRLMRLVRLRKREATRRRSDGATRNPRPEKLKGPWKPDH
jgi:hypothetical protein